MWLGISKSICCTLKKLYAVHYFLLLELYAVHRNIYISFHIFQQAHIWRQSFILLSIVILYHRYNRHRLPHTLTQGNGGAHNVTITQIPRYQAPHYSEISAQNSRKHFIISHYKVYISLYTRQK